MPFRPLINKVSSAFSRERAYQGSNGGHEGLHPKGLGRYEAIPESPGKPATSLLRRLGNMFLPGAIGKSKKLVPVSADHEATLWQIEQAVSEINLHTELQAAMGHGRHPDSTWDVMEETIPSSINDNFRDHVAIGEHTEQLHKQLAAIIGADIGLQACLPGAPRAELVGEKLAHLRMLDRLQRDLAECEARLSRCRCAIEVPKSTSISTATAIKESRQLNVQRCRLTTRIAEAKLKIARVDCRMKEMLG